MAVACALPLMLLPCLVSATVHHLNGSAIASKMNENLITDEVFFDIKIDEEGEHKNETWKGRFVVGVFGEAYPMTSYNFVQLARGFNHDDQKWHYKYSLVHRIVPNFLVQMGDVVYRDGRGGRSVYAPSFIDEAWIQSHRTGGYVAMANTGPDSNGSQFYVTLTRTAWLDKRNVVFGKVVCGMETVRKLGKVEVNEHHIPQRRAYIYRSGFNPGLTPYEMSMDELENSADIKSPCVPDY